MLGIVNQDQVTGAVVALVAVLVVYVLMALKRSLQAVRYHKTMLVNVSPAVPHTGEPVGGIDMNENVSALGDNPPAAPVVVETPPTPAAARTGPGVGVSAEALAEVFERLEALDAASGADDWNTGSSFATDSHWFGLVPDDPSARENFLRRARRKELCETGC